MKRCKMAKSKKDTWVLWSKDEVKLLKKLFPKGKAREIVNQTGRPLTAVRQKAYDMGLKTRECRLWSADEVKLLKKLYLNQNQKFERIADILGRSVNAVQAKARNIGISKCKPCRLWSTQEERLLKALYPTNTASDIAKRLGRSASAVSMKASMLGLTKSPVWSKKELKMLKKLYPSRTAQEIADRIDRSVGTVRQQVIRLGFKKRGPKTKT